MSKVVMRLEKVLVAGAVAVLIAASEAGAVTHELRWVYDPQAELPTMVFVLADGENIAELPVDPPDADGVFTTFVSVPSGSEVQILVQDASGRISDPSNAQVYGDDCHEWDSDGDGVIGTADLAWFRREFRAGTAAMSEFGMFRQVYGQVCPSGG